MEMIMTVQALGTLVDFIYSAYIFIIIQSIQTVIDLFFLKCCFFLL